MAPTRPSRSLALLLGFCAFAFAPRTAAEPLDDPIELGSLDTPCDASGVSVVGTRAYVADGGGGLRVIDSIAIPAPVPEPGALLLQIAAGATLLGVRARRRRGA